MAIDAKEFPQKIEPGLKANKEHTRFFYRFKVNGRTKRGVIDLSDKNWNKKERVTAAKARKLEIEEGIKAKLGAAVLTDAQVSKDLTLNDAADLYFKHKMNGTAYAGRIKRRYDLYCRHDLFCKPDDIGKYPEYNVLGKIKLKELLPVHLDVLKKSMEKRGLSKQTKNGCSVTTIKEIFHQAITPVLKYAEANRLIDRPPVMNFKKQKKKKKTVTHATQKLVFLFNTINDLYRDDPFHRALFLFALYGRRWGEIKTLHWSEVDFLTNTYTVLEKYCKIDETQTFDLPAPIAAALLEIPEDRTGLIFKSPVTGRELSTPKRQLAKIRKTSGIEDLTMHRFRHVLVSAMGSEGVVGTVLSASLGHTDLDTVNEYYLTADHVKASAEANRVVEGLVK